MKNENIKSGANYSWIRLQIDEWLMTGTLRTGTQKQQLDTLGRFLYLVMFYLKNETKLSYEKALKIIEQKYIDKLIENEDIEIVDDMIKIPLGDNSWEVFTSTKTGNSKGGLQKAENDRERAKYRAEDLTPRNLKKMKPDELEKVIRLFPHLKSIDTGMIL